MDTQKFIDFNKEALNTMHTMFMAGMGALTAVHHQAENMLRTFRARSDKEHAAVLDVMENWLEGMQKGHEEFSRLVDQNFEKAQDYLSELEKKEAEE